MTRQDLRSRAQLALALASCATSLCFLDSTVTNLAVTPVAEEFGVDLPTAAWLATAYVIPFAAFLAPAGALADAVGQTRLFCVGTALFTLASLGVALAPDFAVLLAGRAVQGLGAALLLPASLALVLAEVPADRRRPAIALWSAAGALAAAVGPAVGGVVVDRLDWRAVFFLHLPIGAWVLWAARGFLAHDARDRRVPDLAGSVLLALSVGALVYGLTEAPGRGWTSPVVLAAFTGAVIAGCGAGVRSLRHEHPALRTDLLRNTSFATATGISTLYGVALFATMLLGVLFLVDVWDYSALRAGLAMTPAAVVTAATGLGISRLRVPLPPRVMICTGALVEAAATTTLALAITGTAHFVSLWLPVGAVMGVGIGLLTVGIQTGGTLAAPPQHFAAATGVLMASRQLGGALGLSAVAFVLADVGGVTRPYTVVYLVAAGAGLLAAGGGLLLRPPVPAPAVTSGVSELSTRVGR